MEKIDRIIVNRILNIIYNTMCKIVKPDIVLSDVTKLDKKMIDKVKEKYGIEGIILDVDKTIRKNLKPIPEKNKEWINDIKNTIKIVVLTNGIDKNIEKYFRTLKIDYIGFAKKPLSKNFIEACKKMNVPPEKVLVVGNNFITDIYAGRLNEMKTAIVKKVENDYR